MNANALAKRGWRLSYFAESAILPVMKTGIVSSASAVSFLHVPQPAMAASPHTARTFVEISLSRILI